MFRLASPWSLAWMLAALPLALVWWRAARRPATGLFSDLSLFVAAPSSWRIRWRFLPRLLRLLFLISAAVALARPQYGVRAEEITTHGVDIMVVLDQSGSMRALDIRPDRLSEAKRVIEAFIEGRPSDRLGLAVFAKEAFTACPLTLDHQALLQVVDAVDFARQEQDGTAIGMGLGTALNRLKGSDAKSRVVVLVTDGVNNAGSIAPLGAAELAKALGVRVYTIGIGTRGWTEIPMQDRFGRWTRQPMQVDIDEETLQAVASMTGGRYFRADAQESLREIFKTIDGLEKSEIKNTKYVSWSDRFEPPLTIAGLAALFELLVVRFLLARIPA